MIVNASVNDTHTPPSTSSRLTLSLSNGDRTIVMHAQAVTKVSFTTSSAVRTTRSDVSRRGKSVMTVSVELDYFYPRVDNRVNVVRRCGKY
jgi:hypothetical protein